MNTLLFISGPEIIVIIIITVMLFGAKKIPEIAHGLGKGLRQLKDATNEIKGEIKKSADEYGLSDDVTNLKKDINDIKDNIDDVTKPVKRLK